MTTTYIGTPTSRVDGRAKVTGAAQYAAEFAAPDLAYAALVTSTIARGRVARIDASRALAVAGVLDVLTHDNRPKMASTDKAVDFWRYQVTITVAAKNANAPINGLKLNSIPSARPGRATCESASPTSAMCFDTMIEPR